MPPFASQSVYPSTGDTIQQIGTPTFAAAGPAIDIILPRASLLFSPTTVIGPVGAGVGGGVGAGVGGGVGACVGGGVGACVGGGVGGFVGIGACVGTGVDITFTVIDTLAHVSIP